MKTTQIISNILTPIIILVAAISYLYLKHDRITKPYILLVGACFTALNIKNSRMQLFQRLTAFYLFMILTEPFSLKHFIMPLWVIEISVPFSVIILLLLAILHAVSKIKGQIKNPSYCENLPLIIIISTILIAAQMLILFFMLLKFYCYGYEYNFAVLGKLIFVALMFLFTCEIFEKAKVRQLSAVIFAVVFTILTLKGI